MNTYKILIMFIIIATLSTETCYAGSLQDGINAYNQKRYAAAEMNLKNALINNPGNTNVRYYLAISLVQLGKYSEARRHYQYIISTAPGSNAAYWANVGLKMITSEDTTVQKVPSKITLAIEEHNSVIIVKNVTVNNSVNADFIIDTGATYTIINPDLANKLGLNLNNAQKINLITANGTITASKAVLNSVEIKGLSAKNVEVAVSNMGTNSNLPGLLGMSFLKNFKVTIDKSARKLILEKN
ncbi:MAG: TIGR02281 family clan AA aspartic protease [Candidatus Gastranaerophilales bacterium]|nr:TIGR02281 family clan AA aspartic protease [Candidatus Gastranaerophilales bacterium]